MHYTSEAYEQQVDTLQFLMKCYMFPDMFRKGVKEQEHNQWRTDIYALQRAHPYFWNTRTTEIVQQLAPEFNLDTICATRHLVHSDFGFNYFADKCPFEIEDYVSKRMMPVKAITWYVFNNNSPNLPDDKRGLPFLGMTAWTPEAWSMRDSQWVGSLCPTLWSCTLLGSRMSLQIADEDLTWRGYVDERTELESMKMRQFVVAACTFLRQRLLVEEREPVQRQARKRLERRGVKEMPEIRVVQLRRAVTRTHEKKKPEDSTPIERDFSWSVIGHQRNQWYPSLKEHLPIWINEHIKGDPEKPLKPRSTPLFSVTR